MGITTRVFSGHATWARELLMNPSSFTFVLSPPDFEPAHGCHQIKPPMHCFYIETCTVWISAVQAAPRGSHLLVIVLYYSGMRKHLWPPILSFSVCCGAKVSVFPGLYPGLRHKRCQLSPNMLWRRSDIMSLLREGLAYLISRNSCPVLQAALFNPVSNQRWCSLNGSLVV